MQSVLSMMSTLAVCTMFGKSLEPELEAIRPNPVTSTVVPSFSKYLSLFQRVNIKWLSVNGYNKSLHCFRWFDYHYHMGSALMGSGRHIGTILLV